VRTAAERGANLFLEVGPRMILCSAITGTVDAAGFTGRALHTLSDSPAHGGDPIADILARAIANGLEPARHASESIARSICRPTHGSARPMPTSRPRRRLTSMAMPRAIR
jgi:hypothetical protein